MHSNAKLIQLTCQELQEKMEKAGLTLLDYAWISKQLGHISGLAYKYLEKEEKEAKVPRVLLTKKKTRKYKDDTCSHCGGIGRMTDSDFGGEMCFMCGGTGREE